MSNIALPNRHASYLFSYNTGVLYRRNAIGKVADQLVPIPGMLTCLERDCGARHISAAG